MFSLKDSTLLTLDARRNEHNMNQVFGIEHVPSDTTMRESLDEVSPAALRQLHETILHDRGKEVPLPSVDDTS